MERPPDGGLVKRLLCGLLIFLPVVTCANRHRQGPASTALLTIDATSLTRPEFYDISSTTVADIEGLGHLNNSRELLFRIWPKSSLNSTLILVESWFNHSTQLAKRPVMLLSAKRHSKPLIVEEHGKIKINADVETAPAMLAYDSYHFLSLPWNEQSSSAANGTWWLSVFVSSLTFTGSVRISVISAASGDVYCPTGRVVDTGLLPGPDDACSTGRGECDAGTCQCMEGTGGEYCQENIAELASIENSLLLDFDGNSETWFGAFRPTRTGFLAVTLELEESEPEDKPFAVFKRAGENGGHVDLAGSQLPSLSDTAFSSLVHCSTETRQQVVRYLPMTKEPTVFVGVFYSPPAEVETRTKVRLRVFECGGLSEERCPEEWCLQLSAVLYVIPVVFGCLSALLLCSTVALFVRWRWTDAQNNSPRRLSQKKIESMFPRSGFPTSSVDLAESGGSLCSICLCPYKELDDVRELPCGHVFHAEDCLDPWLKRNASCPTCRQGLCERHQCQLLPMEIPCCLRLLRPVNE